MGAAATTSRPRAGRFRGDSGEKIALYALIVLLLALPVYFGIKDLAAGDDLSRLANNLKNGLSNGAILALIAIGYTLVYGIIELINFAHGDLFMIGAFTASTFFITIVGLTPSSGGFALVGGLLLTLLVAMVACGTLNVMIERVAYRPLRGAPKLAPLITAIGFSFILQNVGLLWLGPKQLRTIDEKTIDILGAQDKLFGFVGIDILNRDVLALAVTVPLVILLVGFISRSRAGRAMRATAQDPEAARLQGINVDTTIALTFLLGGMMAGAAGIVSALYQGNVWFFQGFTAGLLAFTAAVLGGIGNLNGAVLGGLILGVIQQVSDSRLEAKWTPALVFAYLIVILIFRPQGLLGEKTREAG